MVSVISLRRMEPGGFFWVGGSTFIGTVKHGEVGFWRYPKGRGIYKEVTGLQARGESQFPLLHPVRTFGSRDEEKA